MLFHRRASSDPRNVVFAAAVYAGLLFCGSIHHFVYFPLVLALDASTLAVSRRSARPLWCFAGVLLLGVALAAVRVVPLLEVYAQTPRLTPAIDRYLSWPLVARAYLASELPDLTTLRGAWVLDGSDAVFDGCTFIGNQTPFFGSGLGFSGEVQAVLRNCVVAGNNLGIYSTYRRSRYRCKCREGKEETEVKPILISVIKDAYNCTVLT